MTRTIYEIDLNNLPNNVSITLNAGLEKTVDDLEKEYEAPVKKNPSFIQKTVLSALAIVLAAMPYVSGCGPNPNPNPDTINPIPASYSVANNMTPADGTTYGPSDSPLEVGVQLPTVPAECSADADCADAASAGVNVVITATADNGTPSDSSDDSTQTVVDQSGAQFGTYVNSTLDFDSFHGGAGLSDGERVTLETTVTAYDADGTAHTADGSVGFVYENNEPIGPQILDNWTLDSANYNRYFSMTFHVSNTGTNMTYDLTSISSTSSWFEEYFNLNSPRIRGPPTIDHGELSSDNPINTWGNVEFVIEACDIDLGVCDEEIIYGSIDRYVGTLVGQNGSRTCTVNITNAAADYIGNPNGSYPGIAGYVETTHTDGSAVTTSEVNGTEAARLAQVSDRIESMPEQMVSDVRRVSSTTSDAPESWDCIEILYTESGEVLYQLVIEEP